MLWSHSSMWGALSMASSCHRVKQSISKSIRKSTCVCFGQCISRTNCGCFTTIIHLFTTSWTSSTSWPSRTLPYCWNNLLFPMILLCETFFFSPLNGIIKGTWFEGVETIKKTVTMELRGTPKEFFQHWMEAKQKRDKFIPSPRALVQNDSQTTLYRIWTWVTNSISNNLNHHTRCASYIYINIYCKKKVSKVGDRSRGWPEGSLFDSYYTKV